MKSKIIIPALLITLAAGFTACQKDSNSTSGNSSLEFQVLALNKSYSLPVGAAGTKSAAVGSASLTWDTAQMVISRVKYEAELKNSVTHHDSVKISYEWNGPQTVNLLDPTAVLGNYTLTPGFYDEIELKVVGLKKDAGNKPVFYLTGSYTNSSSVKVPIMFKVNEDVMFKTEKDSVDVTTDSFVFTSSIQLYLDQLLVGVDPLVLDNATLTNGAIIISAESNFELYQTIMRNLHKDHHCNHEHHHGHN
jgi:hypothetical protein